MTDENMQGSASEDDLLLKAFSRKNPEPQQGQVSSGAAPSASEDQALLNAFTKKTKAASGPVAAPTRAAGQPAKSEEEVGTLEDVGRASLAKFVRGAAAIPGMVGDISKAFDLGKYVPFTRDEYTEKLGFLPEPMRKAVEYATIPRTTDEYIEKISSLHPSIRKTLAYEAKTDPGRYAGAAAEFIPAAIPAIWTGGAPLYARAAGAAAAGVGSQGVSDYLKKIKSPLSGTGYEAAGQFGAALAGGLAGQGVAGKIGGLARGYQGVAAERLAKEMAKDTASKSAKSSLIDGVAPIASGGVRTERLVKNAAARASDESLGAFSGAVSDFRQQAVPKVHQTIDDIFGRPVQAFDEMDMLKQRVKDVNDVNYKRVMSSPEAQAINAPELDSIINRIPRSVVSDMLEQFKIQGVDPAAYGFVKTAKGYELPAQGISLRAWDEIKQGIDSNINKMYDPVTKSMKPGYESDIRNLVGLKSDLVSVLDNAVEPYKAIRFEASELYGARNAVDAGYKFFADKSPKKIFDIKKLVNEKLSPSQKEEFAYGYAAAYKDALDRVKDDPASVLGLYSGKQGSFNADKMKLALGESNANKLLGEVNAQYLNSSIKSLAGGTAGGGVGKAAGAGAISAILGESLLVGENLLQGLSFSMAPQAILGALVAGSARGLYNLRERKIAEQILKLAADPSKYEELGKLISRNKDAGSFLSKFANSSIRKAPAVFNYSQPSMPSIPGQQKTGESANQQSMTDALNIAMQTPEGRAKYSGAALDTPEAGRGYDSGSMREPTVARRPSAPARPAQQDGIVPASFQRQPAAPSEDIFSKLIQTESNGQQFDRNGGTLTSPKGAIGIAQVMPDTGPEAARLAGEPWDLNRLKTDKDYNRRLGEAYFNRQLKVFGDPVSALAAYNAGPGRLREAMAMAKTNGGSFIKYLPMETQDYIRKTMGPTTMAAHGGRINRASGGRIVNHAALAAQLISQADRSKKANNKNTEPLLDEHDNSIAHALQAANDAI